LKKILFIIPTLGGGGAERVLVTLLNNLDKSKYDITLLSIFDEGVNKKYLDKNINYKYYFRKVFRGNTYLLKLFSPKLLYKMIIKENYDIAISYLEGPTTRIISGNTNKNTKLINWVHTEISDSRNAHEFIKSFRNKSELTEAYNKYNANVFVSNASLSAFQNTFGKMKGKMLVRYNTVDTQLISMKSKEKIEDVDLNRDQFNLISVGRFTKIKGYERLLQTIKLLIEDSIDVHLYLVGNGTLESKYREFVKNNGLKKHVTILGFKDNPYKYVRNCDLFVCSSYKEGFSTAVTESLIVGTPVVTTMCSGMEEMLGSKSNFGLITENSDECLYKGIKRMLNEPGLLKYYKERAIERGKNFSTEKSVLAVEELLDNI
jgi:glycosyltransferase involved in cell wall biosynthesis